MAKLDYQYLSKLTAWAKEGDSDAFAELYAATFQQQYALAHRYLKDPYLAQDALQETYIIALKNLHTLKDSKLFVSWLNQINFRVCFGIYEKQKRYNNEPAVPNELYPQQDSVESPEECIIRIDQQDYLRKKILELPELEAQVIILKYYYNMKLDDIAARMSISRSTVKRYLSSGKAKLERTLRP